MSRASTQQVLRQLPTRWALALLGLIVLYAVLQPVANNRLGWKLPSLARMLGEPEPKVKPTARKESNSKESEQQSKVDELERPSEKKSESKRKSAAASDGGTEDEPLDASSVSAKKTATKKAESTASSDAIASPSKSASVPKLDTKPDTKPINDTSSLLYGLLRDTGSKRYVSPAGLQYNPGSEEGHRLKHIEKHLEDEPDRPGKHGVFDGDMPQVIRWVDDAYTRGKRGAKGVRKSDEDGRTVYEVPFDQPIGYIGGRDGKRLNHPPAKRMRLVLDGVKVITAFPF